jgi:uncharacterized protein
MVFKYDTHYFDRFDMAEEKEKYLKQSSELNREFITKKSKGERDPVLFDFIKDNFADIHHRKLFKLPETTYPNGCCPPGIKRLFVDTGGKFHLCEKGNLKFSFGDVNNGLNVKKIFALIDQYAESADHCKHCWALRFCNSCFISAVKNDHFSKERKEEDCQATRKYVLNRLQTYIYLVERNPKLFDGKYERGEDMVEELVRYIKNHKIN